MHFFDLLETVFNQIPQPAMHFAFKKNGFILFKNKEHFAEATFETNELYDGTAGYFITTIDYGNFRLNLGDSARLLYAATISVGLHEKDPLIKRTCEMLKASADTCETEFDPKKPRKTKYGIN